MYSSELFSPELLREKSENDLEISGKTQGKLRENSGNLVTQKFGHPVVSRFNLPNQVN